jgi:two-component system LytT family sensor kinase
MTIRQLLTYYYRCPALRLAAHTLLWLGIWVSTEDPDFYMVPTARLLEVAYAMAGFYLLSYGPVPRWWAQGRYAGPLAAGLLLVLASGPVLYGQYQLANPDSAYDFLPDYRAYGPLVIFTSARYFFYAVFNGLVLNLAAPVLLKLIQTLAEQQLARQRTDELTRRLHLDALLGQVSPHFLFNTLNNLYGLVLHHDPQAPAIARQLATLLRYTDELAARPTVALPEEVAFLDDFLALVRLRYGPQVRLQSQWQLGDAANAELPPLLLLPLVENAVKHGLSPSLGAAWVRVWGEVQGRELVVTVNNSLSVNSSLPVDQPGGLGLRTLRERLHLLYPGQPAALTLAPTATAFVATLRLPLKLTAATNLTVPAPLAAVPA